MAKKNLNYTIIIPEQMPKVAEGVEQQWRVVERTMCSRRDGRNPAGQNPHEWESIAEVKAVLGEGFPSKREAHSFIKKIPEAGRRLSPYQPPGRSFQDS
ncbi:MAG: hypothetical protein WDO70_02410 [Alphaproteobacteria bacterium]